MLKRVNKEQICCPVVFFEEIWGGKYPAGPRASCFIISAKAGIILKSIYERFLSQLFVRDWNTD